MLRGFSGVSCVLCAVLLMSCDFRYDPRGHSRSDSGWRTSNYPSAADSITPPPISTDTVHAAGDHVAFVADNGWFHSDAEVITVGRDMVLVRSKWGRNRTEQWYTQEEYREQGGGYSSATEVLDTKKLLYRLRYPRARGSESEWILPEHIYNLPQRHDYATGDAVLMMHFGGPPDPVVVMAVPSVQGGTYSVRGSGDDRDTWVEAAKLARQVRTATPELLKPGTVVLRDYEYPHLVLEVRGDSCRVRSEFGPSDEWAAIASLAIVEY